MSQTQSQSRINFDAETEQVLNQLIQLYQYCSEDAQIMACHFQKDDVARRNFEMLLWRRSDKLRVGVCKLIRFMNRRGGSVQFVDIPKTTQTEFKDMFEANQYWLTVEKRIFTKCQELYNVAEKHQDSVTMEYVESKLLKKQTKLIKTISENTITLQKNGTGVGEFLFDKYVAGPLVIRDTLKLMTMTPYVYPRAVKDTMNLPLNQTIQ